MSDTQLDPNRGAYMVIDCIPGARFIDLAKCTRDSAFAWKSFGCQLVALILRIDIHITEIWHSSGSTLYVVLRLDRESIKRAYRELIGAHKFERAAGSAYEQTMYIYQCKATSHRELIEMGM